MFRALTGEAYTHPAINREVVGSIPTSSTLYGTVAQR